MNDIREKALDEAVRRVRGRRPEGFEREYKEIAGGGWCGNDGCYQCRNLVAQIRDEFRKIMSGA